MCCADLICMCGQWKVDILVLSPIRNIQLSPRLIPFQSGRLTHSTGGRGQEDRVFVKSTNPKEEPLSSKSFLRLTQWHPLDWVCKETAYREKTVGCYKWLWTRTSWSVKPEILGKSPSENAWTIGLSSGNWSEHETFSGTSMHLGSLMVRLSTHPVLCWNTGVKSTGPTISPYPYSSVKWKPIETSVMFHLSPGSNTDSFRYRGISFNRWSCQSEICHTWDTEDDHVLHTYPGPRIREPS